MGINFSDFDFKKGCYCDNNPAIFTHVDTILPKLKFLKLNGFFTGEAGSVAWNYHVYFMYFRMRKTAKLLFDYYLPWEKKMNLVYHQVWNGVEPLSTDWHHDTGGGNIQFNLYHTDIDPNIGGEIMYRSVKEDNKITFAALPKKYDIVMGSCGKDMKFQHRVEGFRTNKKKERLTMLFRFSVEKSPWT